MTDADLFAGRLLPGERLLWSGRPATGVIFTPRDWFLIPFSAVWCGFVIFWIFGAAASGGGAFILFGVGMLAFGLTLMFGRFLIDAWLRAGARYGLSERRILILRTRPSTNFTAMNLDRLPQVQLIEGRAGRGTVRFGASPSLFAAAGSGFSIWFPALDPTPQFIAIQDARMVFDRVQRASSNNT